MYVALSISDVYKRQAMEIPQLQAIAGKVWKKEDELKQLKSELAALDRKIQLELEAVYIWHTGPGSWHGPAYQGFR